MTQPQRSWIQELLERHYGSRFDFRSREPRQELRPTQVQLPRDRFDPSAYYEQLDMIRNLSRRGTQIVRQQAERIRALERQQQSLSQTILANLPSTDTGYGRPLSNFSVSSGYGYRPRPTAGATTFHQGVDLAAPMGTPIYATHDGYVTNAGWSDGYGYNVSINSGTGVETFYAHQSKLAVKSGQYVRKGQLIGYVGSTGVSTGPHLHYGVKVNGQWINPKGYF